MKKEDFRYMYRGIPRSELKTGELKLLEPVNLRKGQGKGHALLLLHGFSSSPAVYRYLIPKIKHYDALVCPVLPGHAESIESFSGSKAADWVSVATKACEELVKEYDKVDVLGLSLGGLLACQLSQVFSLNHLYLLAPALKLRLPINHIKRLAQALLFLGFTRIRNKAGNLLNQEQAEIAYRQLPISVIIEMLGLAQAYQWAPPACPADLFLGAQDLVVDSEAVEKLFISLPEVSIHWLKNSAHVLPLDNDFKEIIDCINHH